MCPENLPPIETLKTLEHVEQLTSIGQQAQDKNKNSRQKKSSDKKPGILEVLEQEESERQHTADDGHVDYHA